MYLNPQYSIMKAIERLILMFCAIVLSNLARFMRSANILLVTATLWLPQGIMQEQTTVKMFWWKQILMQVLLNCGYFYQKICKPSVIEYISFFNSLEVLFPYKFLQ